MAELDPLGRLEQPVWDLASADQVRRRGDDRTRRRRLRTSVAGAGIAALLAVPGTSLIGVGDATTAGEHGPLPSAASREPERLAAPAEVCGRPWRTQGRPVDPSGTLLIDGTTRSGDPVQRTLLVYADRSAARTALRDLRSRARSCAESRRPVARIDGTGTEAESWGAVITDDDQERSDEVLLAVRVGSRLLVSRSSPAGGDGSMLSELEDEAVTALRRTCGSGDRSC